MKALFAMVMVLALLVSACGSSQPAPKKEVMEQKPAAPAPAAVPNDIGALLAAGTPSECTFSDDSGNQVTMWINGQSYKTKGAVPQVGTLWSLKTADNTFYTWLEGKGFGMRTALADVGTSEDSTVMTGDDFAALGQNVNCKAASLSDADFAPPTGIEFVATEDEFNARMIESMMGAQG